MVVSRLIQIKIYSTIISAIPICLVFNLWEGLFDRQRTSSIISVAYLTIFFGLFIFLMFKKRFLQIRIPDVLIVAYSLFAFSRSQLGFNINQLGDILLILIYIYIRFVGRFNYRYLYATVLFSSLTLSFYGYLQYFGILSTFHEDYSITGPFYNPAPYGALTSFFISIMITIVTGNFQKCYRYISLIFICLSIPALILSNSRAAWMACLITTTIIIVSKHKSKIRNFSNLTRSILNIAIFSTFIILVLSFYHLRPNSVKGRIFIWKIASKMIIDNPITGIGYNGIQANYMNYQYEYFRQERGTDTEKSLAGNVVSVYNEPIRIMIEYGLVGFILYVLIIYFVLFRTTTQSAVSLAAKMVILAYIIFGIFSYPNRIFSLQVVLIIAIACLLNEQKRYAKALYTSKFRQIIAKNVFIVISLLLFMAVILFHYSYQHFQYTLKDRPVQISNNLNNLNFIIINDYLLLVNYCIIVKDIAEESLLLEQLNKAIQLSPSSILYRMKGDYLYQKEDYIEAEKAYWKAHYMVPSNLLMQIKLVRLYVRINKITKAKELARSFLQEKAKSNGIDTFVLRREMQQIISDY